MLYISIFWMHAYCVFNWFGGKIRHLPHSDLCKIYFSHFFRMVLNRKKHYFNCKTVQGLDRVRVAYIIYFFIYEIIFKNLDSLKPVSVKHIGAVVDFWSFTEIICFMLKVHTYRLINICVKGQIIIFFYTVLSEV